MNCCFSGRPVPTDKLFILYYPPAAAHETWDKSFFAAARAGEALAATLGHLDSFFSRHVVSRDILPGIVAGAAGLAVLAAWLGMSLEGWSAIGFGSRYLLPAASLLLLLFAWPRLRGFLYRWRLWRQGGREQVAEELEAITALVNDLPEDPDAEDAAVVMRRECPDSLSEIAFSRNNFKAFTYMDFVLCPQFRHPMERAELPQRHSLYRDAYYVGEVVYDNWRTFQRDRRLNIDPRFAGSGGRRGVI